VRRGARTAFAVAAGISVAALVGACTAGSPAAITTSSASSHVLWWDISTQTGASAAITSLVAGFEQLHPGVKVDVVAIPVDQARGRFDTAALTTSGAPDVVTLDSNWVAEFASRGYLARLDNTPAVDPVDDQFPNLVPTATYDGRVVALPRSADGPALLYNVALLKIAGVSVPRTWAELAADRLKLTAHGVQTLYAPADSDGLLPWIYGEGGSLLDPNAKTINVNSAAAVAALAARVALDATGVAVDDSSAGSVDAMQTAFRQGRVAMILDDAASLQSLVGGTATPSLASIGIAPVPAGSVTSSSPLTGTAYAVYEGSLNLQAAYQLVHYLDTAGSQAALAARLGLLPTRASAYSDPQVKDDPVIQAFQVVVRTGTPLPQLPGSADLLLPPLDDALRQALMGNAAPQKLLDSVAAAYNRTLTDFTIGPAAS
jgi:arabinogalactan oligomer/maltooligosaccharide transport system substrate-binding protein